jgi:hypothetical protein
MLAVGVAYHAATAASVRALTERGVTMLEDEPTAPIDPRDLVALTDGVLVVGKALHRVWAARTDASGKALWTYHVEHGSTTTTPF